MFESDRDRGRSLAAEELLATGDMVAQYAYCPRRFHLMYVEGLWQGNQYTDDGKFRHGRIDDSEDLLPVAGGDNPPAIVRSVMLTDDALRISAKLDIAELHERADGTEAVPVEKKRAKVPDNPERSWAPERHQLMLQGLLLRSAGYACGQGVLYYEGSRTRVPIAFDDALESSTRALISRVHAALQEIAPPAPLDDSPKCIHCSLNGICLPDETRVLASGGLDADKAEDTVRRLYPPRDDAVPFYIQAQGAHVCKKGETLQVKLAGSVIGEARLIDVSQLVLCGNVSLTPFIIKCCADAGIPIMHLSLGHYFYGMTAGFALRNAFDRAAQFRTADDSTRCLVLARAFVAAKGANQRTLLRRNGVAVPQERLAAMQRAVEEAESAESLESLLGHEGSIAAIYFENFQSMLRPKSEGMVLDVFTRNRRPPRDPVNAMLSFCYALLVKDCTVALAANGLDPFWGFYHKPRHGRPALALDIMEEFRPLVADSAVLTAINTGMVDAGSFNRTASACMLNDRGRKAVIHAYELRMDQLVTHPFFGYRLSWRRIIHLQVQLLVRFLRGSIPEYRGIVTR